MAVADICRKSMIFVKLFVGIYILIEGVSGLITVRFTFIV